MKLDTVDKNQKNDKPIVHLYMRGACGNQFFQYAFARNLVEQLNADLEINYHYVRIDKNLWEGSDNLLCDFNVMPYAYKTGIDKGIIIITLIRWIRNVLRLKDFRIRTYKAMVRWADILSGFGIYYFDAAYYPFKPCNKKNIYVFGYFESAKYFGDIDGKIKEELAPIHNTLKSNSKMLDTICTNQSVCVTIKRQDIENDKISSIYDYSMEYFYSGIEYIKSKVENPVFVIFSDDIQWCKSNLRIDGTVIYENEGNPIWEKIRLMSSCKHFIIHNSTFSWWVQHLSDNPNKIVIAPSLWMKRNDQPIDIYEDNWVFLDGSGKIAMSKEDNYFG